MEAELEVDVGLADVESGVEVRNVAENKCKVEPVAFEGEGKSASTSVVKFASSRNRTRVCA